MNVYEVSLKVFLLKDLLQEDILIENGRFIDQILARDQKYLEYHEKNTFKYNFGGLYPVEKSKIYRRECIYQLVIRTCDEKLAHYLRSQLPEYSTESMKGLVAELRVIPKKHITTLYTLTPVIVKSKTGGYWRDDMTLEDFEKRLKINLIKKYNLITGEKLSEDFELYTLMQFTNRKPIAVKYKNIKLLGDKVELKIADNQTAQDLAYAAIGLGLCEMNARGYGFLSYHFI